MRIDTLEECYVESLKDLYHAGHQMLRALPRMAGAATSPGLCGLIQKHVVETRAQLERLDIIFDGVKTDPLGKRCKPMEALLAECDEMIQRGISGPARDASLISAAQRIEHYAMSGCETLLTYARRLEEWEAVDLLVISLRELNDSGDALVALAGSSSPRNPNLEAAVT